MFEFLFKYPADTFAHGELSLAGPFWLYCALLFGTATILTVFYAHARADMRRRDRVVLALTRTAALAIILFALFQPALNVTTLEARGNVVIVLLDDSRSMRIEDQDGGPRSAFVRQAFDPETGDITQLLAQRFVLRFFRFAAGVHSLQDHELDFSGHRTDLARALADVRQELSDPAVAAVVIVSDGAITEGTSLDQALSSLRVAGIPIHTVGVGQTKFTKDIELTSVAMPRHALKESAVTASVLINHRGADNEKIKLLIEDDGQLIAMQEVTLLSDQPAQPVEAQLITQQAGVRQLKFHIVPVDGEIIANNNARNVVVDVENRRQPILHFEGEPRFEVKFIRRAVAKDDAVRVVSLVRTAENKFYRLGVEHPQELADGFPQRPQDLYAYRGLILGSVEASYFTSAQLQMIADFVARRGGSLLLLGGRRAFATGGYLGTPLAELSPLVLEPKPSQAFQAEVAVRPTPRGRTHPLTDGVRDDASDKAWTALPPLMALHSLHRVKPGALILLEGRAPSLPAPLPVLTQQRFGRGQVLAFNAHDTWRWQMHQDLQLDDQSHERLWRQLLRWLVQSAPDRVTIHAAQRDVSVNESVEIIAEVVDAAYLPQNNADVHLRVTTPLGDRLRLPMTWLPASNGAYRADFTPPHPGLYDLQVELPNESGLKTPVDHIQVGMTTREYFQAEMREPLLRRLADETGGRFYTAGDASKLADAITTARASAAVQQRLELWDMPAGLLLLLALLCLEWVYRRRRGLV
mgnify:FL=1